MTRSGKLGTTLKSRLHQNFLSHEVVTRSRMKTENLAFLESVTRQFSSLPIRLESISNTFYMQGWKLSRCVNVNQLLIERAISHLCPRVEISNIISQSKLNEKPLRLSLLSSNSSIIEKWSVLIEAPISTCVTKSFKLSEISQ